MLERTAGDAEASRLPGAPAVGERPRRFRTIGSTSSGSVRGTKWLTVDSCAGTLTVVVEGVVLVHDFSNGELVAVHAGDRYFARACAKPVGHAGLGRAALIASPG